MILLVVLAAAGFAAAAALGIVAARFVVADIEAAPDGPPVGVVPVRALIIGSAVFGAIAAARGFTPYSLTFIGVAFGLLAAIWASDVTAGIIPDVFTLFPLGAVVLANVAAVFAQRQTTWNVSYLLISIVVPALPFAFVAWRSRGLGLGWGDVKLAACGGPLLGLQNSLLAFSVGCALAVIVARVQRSGNAAIAFGPYLAASLAVPLAVAFPTH